MSDDMPTERDFSFRLVAGEDGWIFREDDPEGERLACALDIDDNDPNGAQAAAEMVRRWNAHKDLTAFLALACTLQDTDGATVAVLVQAATALREKMRR